MKCFFCDSQVKSVTSEKSEYYKDNVYKVEFECGRKTSVSLRYEDHRGTVAPLTVNGEHCPDQPLTDEDDRLWAVGTPIDILINSEDAKKLVNKLKAAATKNQEIPVHYDSAEQSYWNWLYQPMDGSDGYYSQSPRPCYSCLNYYKCPNSDDNRITCPVPDWNIVPVGWDK